MLNQLTLPIQKSLKFLDAFCFGIKYAFMFPVWQSYQIFNSIIVFDTIKMVNYPSFRQQFSISIFPNHSMFSNVSTLASKVMLWQKDKDITPIAMCPTAFPRRGLFPFRKIMLAQFPRLPHLLCPASPASFGMLSTRLVNRSTTFWAYFGNWFNASLRFAMVTALCQLTAWLATVNTFTSVELFPPPALFLRPHILIITYLGLEYNLYKEADGR